MAALSTVNRYTSSLWSVGDWTDGADLEPTATENPSGLGALDADSFQRSGFSALAPFLAGLFPLSRAGSIPDLNAVSPQLGEYADAVRLAQHMREGRKIKLAHDGANEPFDPKKVEEYMSELAELLVLLIMNDMLKKDPAPPSRPGPWSNPTSAQNLASIPTSGRDLGSLGGRGGGGGGAYPATGPAHTRRGAPRNFPGASGGYGSPLPGPVSAIDQANRFFITQWGSARWNSISGAPYGYNDCGPTSAVMALAALGIIDSPGAANAENAINAMRDRMNGGQTDYSAETNFAQIIAGVTSAGGKAAQIDTSLASVDAALQNGPVIICGDPWNAWGASMDASGNYLNHQDPSGHYVVILGKTPDGNYIVADPLSSGGAICVSGAQIQQFWADAPEGSAGAIATSR